MEKEQKKTCAKYLMAGFGCLRPQRICSHTSRTLVRCYTSSIHVQAIPLRALSFFFSLTQEQKSGMLLQFGWLVGWCALILQSLLDHVPNTHYSRVIPIAIIVITTPSPSPSSRCGAPTIAAITTRPKCCSEKHQLRLSPCFDRPSFPVCYP